MSEQSIRQQLLKRIEHRRQTVLTYLRSARPRVRRLTNISVISSALAAALTAGPALGGPRFTAQVAGSLQLGSAEGVWRPLCLLAMIVSVTAAIFANLSRSKNAETRIINAEACCAELEGLLTLIEFGQMSVEDAVKLYQQYIAKIPFVPDTTEVANHSGSR